MDTRGKLGLGTVQFGLDYGATNTSGKVPESAVSEILRRARDLDIDLLDTAALYGDSERAIGATGLTKYFNVVTKTEKVSDCKTTAAALDKIERAFHRSLERLGSQSVYGLMVHDAGDLLGAHGEPVWRLMQRLRADKLVLKVGVSVYSADEIDRILSRYDIDLIQVPYNAIDRRLLEGGQLHALASRGIEVHARSIFLQGVLLQDADRLPLKLALLAPSVQSMREHFTTYGLTVMEGLIASALHHEAIGRLVIGVTNVGELNTICDAAQKLQRLAPDFEPPRLTVPNDRLLNPATWAER